MPFPLLVPFGAAIASAIGTAAGAAATVGAVAAAGATAVATAAVAAAPFLAAGAAVLGGLAITGYIVEQNERAQREAREAAEKIASREREKELLKKKTQFEEKVSNLEKQYGSKVPQNKQEEILKASSVLLGEFEGNKAGLATKGQSSSSKADAAAAELIAFQEQCGLKK
ncbi:hypothetical protein NLA06_08020 [Desulfomicrobium sp. ZS1]|uniref:hypothetical protein n=1 Tax=Desulfomicrobium sp. ZS1 TaxID=2952228 RepID=UPI0020B2DA16|nr:hypothetical protein [Desulfomicrobium sp. ZS1]UTF51820.1 hypothetical protein NLA06_08020 [Desulfomicrobium sp. ZS1]